VTPLPADGRRTVLVHGVSVGEVAAARGLVDALVEADPELRVAISATTNTGFARARALYGERHPVVRFPFDFSWMVRRFLDAARPDALVLMELEVWPNLLRACARRGIPVVVVNGRLSETSFRGYRRVGPLVRPMFRRLTAVGAQTETYAGRFVELGVPPERVSVTDNTKWDNVAARDDVPGSDELAAALGIDRSRPLVVAGSTGPGEEQMLVSARPAGVQLLLVPRKPERFDEVARLAPGIVRRTERPDGGAPARSRIDGTGDSAAGGNDRVPDPTPAADLFLLDTMGELDKAYALADVAVVGRSFAAMGGSDPIPPVALGKPTIIGPNHQNFDHVVEALADAGAVVVTDEPMRTVAELLADPERRSAMAERGRAVIRERQGASRRSAELIVRALGGADPA
jgi:3-deoxy-D-manno-octulosonic-acid transferase